MYAAEKGHVGVIAALLKAGADVKAKDRFVLPSEGGGETALFYAIHSGHPDAVRALITAGAAVNAKACGETPLSIAVRLKNCDLVEALIKLGADPKKGSSLEAAIDDDNAELARLLLAAGANPNKSNSYFGTTPLMEAARRGQLEICKLLLEHGADPDGADKSGATPLMEAATGGVFFGLETEGDWQQFRDDPRLIGSVLKTGANAGEFIELLVSKGADINYRSQHGWTALMCAVLENREDTQKTLLRLGASEEGTVLAKLFRAMEENAEGVEIYELARQLPSLNVRTRYGAALWEAARMCAGLKLVKMFIQMGMSPNNLSKDGDPLLKEAIQAGDGEFVMFLVERGGDLRLKDAKGGDARRWARGVKDMPRFIGHLLNEAPQPKSTALELRPNSEFGSIARELEKRFSMNAESLKGEGATFRVSNGMEVVEELQPGLLERGVYLFESAYKSAISVLPTTDPYAVIEFMGTNGVNYDLDTKDIVAWLKELQREQPFQLTGIGGDFLAGHFTTPLKNTRKLAKAMYEFCPDIVDQGTGTVANLASELKKNGKLFFWWD